MATATLTQRLTSCPTPDGQFSVENPEHHNGRTVCADLTEAAAFAAISSGFHPGMHVHVFDDHGRVVGWVRDGVGHGAVA